MSISRSLLLGVLGALFIITLGANSMSKLVLFSEVRGVVLSEGLPVQGAVVEREYYWASRKTTGRDSTTTGTSGEFHLPSVTSSSLLASWLPHQPVIRQTILIKHGGRTYEAWMFDKQDYTLNGERNGRPIVLECSLGSPLRHSPEGVYGMCDLK